MNKRESDLLLRFGQHFKMLRKKHGFTQESLSYASDITLSQIARIETGKINPTLCTILTLAKTMGADKRDLLDF
nr:helix-turn-helix transcriptional regulator [Chitinophagaceae bacterium]